MREYGRIASTIWDSDDFRSLSEDGRHLVLYLLANKHVNLTGCYKLPVAYAAEDLQWDSTRVLKGFGELSQSRFIHRDEASQWVLVDKFLKWNQFENPNVAKSAEKHFATIRVDSLKPLLAKAFLEFASHLRAEFVAMLQTLAEGFREGFANPIEIQNQNQNQSLYQNQSQNQGDAAGAAPSGPPEPSDKPAKRERPVKASEIPVTVTVSDLISDGVEEQHAREWLRIRKDRRASLTPTAWETNKREGRKLGLSPRQVVKVCASAGWQGLQAHYPWRMHLGDEAPDLVAAVGEKGGCLEVDM